MLFPALNRGIVRIDGLLHGMCEISIGRHGLHGGIDTMLNILRRAMQRCHYMMAECARCVPELRQ